jgi:hypothetical protein
MVHVMFTARLRTLFISPKFALMAPEDAVVVPTEQREVSAKQPEGSLDGEQVVASIEVTLEQGVVSDRGNQSKGSCDSKIAFDNRECVKIGAEAALADMGYDCGRSKVTKACLASLESSACYFLKGYDRPPSVESVPDP